MGSVMVPSLLTLSDFELSQSRMYRSAAAYLVKGPIMSFVTIEH